MRRAFMLRHPICAKCKRESSTVLDHIVPHRGVVLLFWSQRNWQALCARCHGIKTACESGWSEQEATF
jgi:5-methylcytosine-specific restriction protein A